MHRVLAGLAIVTLSLAAWTGAALAGGELKIISASLEGTSVVLKVENTTKDQLVTGRALGRANNGTSIQDDVVTLEKIPPGVHEVTLNFPEKGAIELHSIQDGPDGFPPTVVPKPGFILVGTILDDINPF